MNKKQIAITLGIMCFLLTIAICVQIKTMDSANSTVSKTLSDNGLRDEVLKMKEKYDTSYSELEDAQKKLEEVRQTATQNDTTATAKEKELKDNNMLLGNTDVEGEGVEVILQDAPNTGNALNPSDRLIHFSDIQWVVNELKNAGAEAIEVNGQRIVNTTAITCVGNTVMINGERVGSPFIINAIGNPERLYGQITMPESYYDKMKTDGVDVKIEKVNSIDVPKYTGLYNFEYAQAVE